MHPSALPASPKNPTLLAASSPKDAEAEKIIGQFHLDPNRLKTDTKRGCLVAFGIGFGLFVLTAFIAYWLYARHLGRWW